MPIHYPPAAPTLSGDALTIDRFLKDPTLVARRLRTLAEQRFIADVLLSARLTTDSGSILYETGESIYSDRAPEAVAPGSEYPLTTVGTGEAQLAKTVKWGRDVEITDESISRQKIDPVNRALTKLVNNTVKTIDSVALAAIASTVTQASAALSSWASGTPNIFRDIARAKAKIRALNEGFEPDTVVVDDVTFANIISDPAFALLLPRESRDTPVFTGNFPIIDGMRILPSPNLAITGRALIADTVQLGGMADENLGGPGYVSAEGVGIQAKTIRKDDEDKWRVRARRVTVPIVLEPKAAWWITGVDA
ncbi:major capsid protein [Gordonia phage Clark]|uniref:Major capsid protein n=2 Tax=Beenievirus TaxID=3044673 RepID=A0A4Y6EGT9_9CAUD|nr:major head protein [Gordonia phage Dorito]YP_010654402.1 major head protein [Gordonia phage Clark]AZS07276.1 major capsid protein [Gordonia phage Dorito]QDF17956.1 major capsid protein [Gordonia phage Clark]